MPTLHRTVETTAQADAVFTYLTDFEHAAQWDSGTVECVRLTGDGSPGTTYRNVSKFAGRRVELTYTVEQLEEPTFVIVGRNATTTTRDTITVIPLPAGGSTVDYHAEFTFTGPARFLGPLMRPLLERLGDKTAGQLARVLDSGAAR